MRFAKRSFVSLVNLLLISPTAYANLLVNGDFSQGPSGSPFVTVVKGQTSIEAWNVERNSVDYVTTLWMEPSGATASIDVNGTQTQGHEKPNQPGILTQAFATTVGATYQLTFYLSGNPQCGPNLKKLLVEVGNSKANFSWNITKEGNTTDNMEWTLETVPFTATSASTVLNFISTTKIGLCGPAIALVSVDPVGQTRVGHTGREAGLH